MYGDREENVPPLINREALVGEIERMIDSLYDYHKPDELKDRYIRAFREMETCREDINGFPKDEVGLYQIELYEEAKEELEEIYKEIVEADLIMDGYYSMLYKVKTFKG